MVNFKISDNLCLVMFTFIANASTSEQSDINFKFQIVKRCNILTNQNKCINNFDMTFYYKLGTLKTELRRFGSLLLVKWKLYFKRNVYFLLILKYFMLASKSYVSPYFHSADTDIKTSGLFSLCDQKLTITSSIYTHNQLTRLMIL